MQFAPAVVMHCGVYEFGCCKVDKSWTKETCNLAACLGIFNAEKTEYVVVHNGVARALLYLTTLQNDIKVDSHFITVVQRVQFIFYSLQAQPS